MTPTPERPASAAPPAPPAADAPAGAAAPANGSLLDLHDGIEQVLITETELARRIAELAAELRGVYEGQDLVLVGVLKGAIMFMTDLARQLRLPLEMDFMAVSSYGDATQSSGIVRITKDLDGNIAGRNVLLVEDIVDSGATLRYLLENLRSRDPASLRVCALLNKRVARKADVAVEHVGFEIPNRFVVGYGLDFAEQYRNLPYIGVLKSERYAP
jgi:hypoxanthine phosphoribosyltransferase